MTFKLTPLALLLLAILFTLSTHALPTPRPLSAPAPSKLARFTTTSPRIDTVWLIDSLPQVAWDQSSLPEGATLDITLVHPDRDPIVLRRYVPASKGSTLVNVPPTISAGTYSLLLTAFSGRSTSLVANSVVHSVILIEDEDVDPEQETPLRISDNSKTSTTPKSTPKDTDDEFSFKKQHQNAVLGTEQVQLTHQPTKSTLVLRAPYTVGWSIPKPLEHARHVRVNLKLVTADDKVTTVLATNVDAKSGFMYVHLPADVPLQSYRIKVEVMGKGRKFVGYTNRFRTSLPAFASRSTSA
ncbi:hypothetical protein BGW38_005718 [Lunasporangiospora selenospora]|uniref:Ig-like domain-containing protein n=1 Tax=Lunasporangiospora selenospora TaxID=979761 RepID=A0A9P6KH91_9FUNG|nr:hypothetical protein BGW38_005718 [Lunasporangiospora selenospora]